MKKTIKKLSFSGKIRILSAFALLLGLLFFAQNAQAQTPVSAAGNPIVSKYAGNINQANLMDIGSAKVVLKTEILRLMNQLPTNRTQKMEIVVKTDYYQYLYQKVSNGVSVSEALKDSVAYAQSLNAKYNTNVDIRRLLNDAVQLLSN